MIRLNMVSNYRDNLELREDFFLFIPSVFSEAHFKEWYEKKYWTDTYIPFSLLHENKIISNVSATKMNILVQGQLVQGIQIGSVATASEWMGKGLAKYLLNNVMDYFAQSTDLFFLFAYESVLNFYPKFGFRQVRESLYLNETNIRKPQYQARKLDMHNEADVILIKSLLLDRKPITQIFGAVEYDFVAMWNFLNVYQNHLYYLEKESLLFVKKEENEQLIIWDIVSKHDFDMNDAVSKVMISPDITSILYYFPPDQLNFSYDRIVPDMSSHLFVKGYFPLDGGHFKFPELACT